jgi:hypothetical protein
MKVGKLARHTNYTTRLLCFDFEFDATLLSFELASKEGIAKNLGGITKKNLLSGLQLDLKKKGRTMLVILLSHSLLKPSNSHNTNFKRNLLCALCTLHIT